MAAPTIKGIQLPPDSTGKITGAFVIPDPDGDVDSGGILKQIVIPATVLVNSTGDDIGGEILTNLQEIAQSLKALQESNQIILEALND